MADQNEYKDNKAFKQSDLKDNVTYYKCPRCLGHGTCRKFELPAANDAAEPQPIERADAGAGIGKSLPCELCEGKGYFDEDTMTNEQREELKNPTNSNQTKTAKMLTPLLLGAVGAGAFGGYQAAGTVRDAMYEVQDTVLDKYTKGEYFFKSLELNEENNTFLNTLTEEPTGRFADTSLYDRYTTMVTGEGQEEWGNELNNLVGDYINASHKEQAQVLNVIDGNLGESTVRTVDKAGNVVEDVITAGDHLQSIQKFVAEEGGYAGKDFSYTKQLGTDIIFGGVGIVVFMLLVVGIMFYFAPRKGGFLNPQGHGSNMRWMGSLIGVAGALMTGVGMWTMEITGEIDEKWLAEQVGDFNFADASNAIEYVSRFNACMSIGAILFGVAVIMGIMYWGTANKDNNAFQKVSWMSRVSGVMWTITAGCTIGASVLANDLIKQSEHLGHDLFLKNGLIEIGAFVGCCAIGLIWLWFQGIYRFINKLNLAPGLKDKTVVMGAVAASIVLGGGAAGCLTANFILKTDQMAALAGGLILAIIPIILLTISVCVGRRGPGAADLVAKEAGRR